MNIFITYIDLRSAKLHVGNLHEMESRLSDLKRARPGLLCRHRRLSYFQLMCLLLSKMMGSLEFHLFQGSLAVDSLEYIST